MPSVSYVPIRCTSCGERRKLQPEKAYEPGAFCGGVLTYREGGHVFIMTDPLRRRQGIVTQLMAEALRRWPDINFQAQKYTETGAKFIQRFLEKRALEE